MTTSFPYAAFFLGFPVVITAPGQYVTRSGEVVEVDDDSSYHWKRGRYQCGTVETWHRSGRIFSGTETANDIVQPVATESGLAP
jgi:hypothetical protein